MISSGSHYEDPQDRWGLTVMELLRSVRSYAVVVKQHEKTLGVLREGGYTKGRPNAERRSSTKTKILSNLFFSSLWTYHDIRVGARIFGLMASLAAMMTSNRTMKALRMRRDKVTTAGPQRTLVAGRMG